MTTKAITLTVCCASLIFGALACSAQTFGNLQVGPEARAFRTTTSLVDPAIAKWLMTLPADATGEPTATEAAVTPPLLDGNPIGGDVYHLASATGPLSADKPAPTALGPQLFDSHSIGGGMYRLKPFTQPAPVIAENVAKPAVKPRQEGRSVGTRAHRRSHPAQTTAMVARPPKARSGLFTGRSAAKRAIHWQRESEGHADLPAPRGYAVPILLPAR